MSRGLPRAHHRGLRGPAQTWGIPGPFKRPGGCAPHPSSEEETEALGGPGTAKLPPQGAWLDGGFLTPGPVLSTTPYGGPRGPGGVEGWQGQDRG